MKFKKGLIRRSLYFSILDGLFTALMMGVSESYLIPYGIALGATPGQVSLLATLPLLSAAIFQTFSAPLTQKIGSRTRLINRVVFFHALSWLPIVAIPFCLKGGQASLAPWALLASLVLYHGFGAFTVPAWQSLMSDYIPTKKRGKYFGWRNRLQGVLMTGVSIAAGLILHVFERGSIYGFTAIFIFAMICRFCAWRCLLEMKEPFRKSSHDSYFSFRQFIAEIGRSDFGRLSVFIALLTAAANVSASLFSVFLLKDLGLSYAAYMMVVTTASCAGFLAQGIWGAYGDAFGNRKILMIAGWGVALIPATWVFTQDLRIIFFVQLLAGAFWGGMTLLSTNFLLESLEPERRIRGMSYFNVLNSASVVAAAAAGAWLYPRLPKITGYSFLSLFLLSCLLRAAILFFLGRRVREVRRVA